MPAGMHGLRSRHGRVSLLATLLLIPLLHGAGAHLTAAGDRATQLSAATTGLAGHAVDEPCALCVTARTAGERIVASAPVALAARATLRAMPRPDEAAGPPLPRARPDSPRAPPHPSA
jgi:hypothetical protein